MGISAKGVFFGWLGCWINDKQIIFSYDNWVFGDWRMCKKKKRRGKKMVSTLGLLLIPCYVISKYDLIVLISKISYMDA